MGIDLRENSTQSMDRSIVVQDERFVEIRILQQGRGEDGCAKCIKGFLVFSGPVEWCGLFTPVTPRVTGVLSLTQVTNKV